LRNKLVQQTQLLGPQLLDHLIHAGKFPARPIEACDQAQFDRVAAGVEHDGDRRSRRLGCSRGRFAAAGGENGNGDAYQLCRKSWQAIVVALRPTIFDL
jgi:hypothetical protein